MRRTITLAALVLGAAAPVFAQESPATEGETGVDEASDWKVDARFTLVGAAIDDETPLAPAGDGLLASGSLVVSREDTFDNGLTLGWRGEARLERDAASRPGFVGVLGGCPASNALCPRVSDGGAFVSPISPATGLAAGGFGPDEDGFMTLEGASVSLAGAWGETVVGLDTGVAARLDARAPAVFQRVSASSPGLDPTGLVVARARNDVTGSSAKVSYMSPRWIGFRLGASYTPEANQRGADFDPDFSRPGLGKAELENVWEGAASFSRQFAEQDLRVRAALTYTTADSGSALTGFGQHEAWGAGLELEHDGWTGGVRWLSSNNAWNSGNGDYEAWEAGLVRESGDWRFGVEAGWAEDRLTGIEGSSWLVGASRKINDNVELGAGWSSADADLPVLDGLSVGHTNARNDGLIVELTVRN